MKAAKIPPNEAARQNRLEQFQILDSAAEREFQNLVELAAHIMQTPMAFISLVDRDRQWFKARVGAEISETPRSVSFCAHVVSDSEMLVVPDAAADARFHDNPLVTGDAQVRAYAGAQLVTEDGYTLGGLCAIDTEPRQFSEEQLRMLTMLANQVMAQMNLRLLTIRQKESIAVLTESEEKFRQLADHIEGTFWLIDAETKHLQYISGGSEKMFGLRPEEFYAIPDAIFRVVHPEDHGIIEGFLRQNIRQEYTFEYRLLRPDGTVRYVRDRAQPVFASDGSVRRLCGIAVDVTKEVEGQRELERQRAQSIQSSKLSAIGEMSAGVAHEINNPIAIILGKAYQLRTLAEAGQLDDAAGLKIAERIEITANRIAKIVKALLHYSREGSQDSLRPCGMNQLIDDILPLCAERFRENAVGLTVDYLVGDVPIPCRPVELSQVLLNLLNNAFDAVKGQPEAWVRLECSAEENFVEYRVTDSGPGVPPDHLAKIFDPFFTTKEPGKGTGIGLSLARGIVEAHEGKIWVDSTSAYTRFCVKLPRQAKTENAAA